MAGKYIFKPMKGLTFWALLLIGLKLAGLAAYGSCEVIQAATGVRANISDPQDALSLLTLLSALLYYLFALLSGIVSLVWIYGATRNALAIRPGINVSPGWAVGWFFVPIAGLFKPYQYLADVWRASGLPGAGREPPGWMLGWWLSYIIGTALTNIASRLEDGMAAAGDVADIWLTIFGLGLLFIASALFFRLVRAIHTNQQATYSGLNTAEVF
ncbi:MAG: DUF4328 domain-containing protein [Asticcacaulis sp.]|nr:DUF4328 domain-containing protein [Asticcacaulis sp.]